MCLSINQIQDICDFIFTRQGELAVARKNIETHLQNVCDNNLVEDTKSAAQKIIDEELLRLQIFGTDMNGFSDKSHEGLTIIFNDLEKLIESTLKKGNFCNSREEVISLAAINSQTMESGIAKWLEWNMKLLKNKFPSFTWDNDRDSVHIGRCLAEKDFHLFYLTMRKAWILRSQVIILDMLSRRIAVILKCCKRLRDLQSRVLHSSSV